MQARDRDTGIRRPFPNRPTPMKARPLFSLAALAYGALGIGGMQAANTAHSSSTMEQHQRPVDSNRYARKMANEAIIESMLEDYGARHRTGDAPPASWHKKNQRQIRLARRRRSAGGDKKAFR